MFTVKLGLWLSVEHPKCFKFDIKQFNTEDKDSVYTEMELGRKRGF